MILADKIIDLRKKNGWSQEELAEKLGVSRQAVSKWEGAQSMPDMGRIVQMSELFDVSTDYLLKDDIVKEEPSENGGRDRSARTIGMEEANTFLALRERNSRHVALGVMLCILSPILLILLGGAQELGLLSLTENQAAGAGLVVLILMVGIAVALFVSSSLRIADFEYLEKEAVETLYGVDGMVRDRKEKFRPVFTRQLTIGIVLCVLATVPLFVSMFFAEEDSFQEVISVAVLLLLVAIGVLLIVRVSMVWGGFQMLLEEGDYSRENKEISRRYAWFGGVYWGLVTAGYLALSFLTENWDRTWIVWPVAGVAYGAVFAIARAVNKKGD